MLETTLERVNVTMRAMPYTPARAKSRFWAVVGVGWVVLGFSAFWYAQMKGIPGLAAGRATSPGMPFICAYQNAAKPSTTHPTPTTAQKRDFARAGVYGIALIVTFTLSSVVSSIAAAEPPEHLAKLVAARETATAEERGHYAYTQTVRLQEL